MSVWRSCEWTHLSVWIIKYRNMNRYLKITMENNIIMMPIREYKSSVVILLCWYAGESWIYSRLIENPWRLISLKVTGVRVYQWSHVIQSVSKSTLWILCRWSEEVVHLCWAVPPVNSCSTQYWPISLKEVYPTDQCWPPPDSQDGTIYIGFPHGCAIATESVLKQVMKRRAGLCHGSM